MSNIHIDLAEDISVVTYAAGKVNKKKTVSTGLLLKTLSDASGLSTPLLPPGTRLYKIERNITKIYIEVPPQKRKTIYNNRSGKGIFNDYVPMPWELFCFEFSPSGSQMTLSGCHVYAMKNPIMGMDTPLYYMPLPNVFGDCRVCWGNTLYNNSTSVIQNMTQAYKFISIFHDAEFNTDLTVHLAKGMRFEDVLRELKGKDEYNNEFLVPWGTFGQIV